MDCSEAGTMLEEFALDVLPGDQRTALLSHLEECPSCRQLLDGLLEAADVLLLAGPGVAPPAGFEDRVLARIQAPRARARKQARLRLLAAAAAAAVLLGVGGLTGAHFRGSGDSGGSGESAQEFQVVQLISTSGSSIGDVSMYVGRPAWFFMRLEGALPNGTYQCVLDTDEGRTVPIGSLWAHDGRGAWGEKVRLDPAHVKGARLVDSHGATVGTAQIH
jgi:hypothetical protein